MSVYPSVDELRKEINEVKSLLNEGDPNKIDRRSLIQLYETTNNRNLHEMKEETLQLMEKYLSQLKDVTLEIDCNPNNISDNVERLKTEVGMSNLQYSILKKIIAPIYVNYKLRKHGKRATPKVRRYLTDLFVYIILEERKIKKEIEEIYKILEYEGHI